MTNFASKNLTLGQLNAFVKQAGGEQVVRDCLSGKSQLLISQKEAIKRLERIGEVVLPDITGPFNPTEFFKTRKGLHVWDSFRERILPATKQVNSVPEATIMLHKLVKDSNSTKIRAEMPDNHVFEDASSFCGHLADMIDRQSGGKDGDLLVNGYANVFYVRGVKSEVFAVSADWDSDGREWRVRACMLVGYRWGAGYRVISSN